MIPEMNKLFPSSLCTSQLCKFYVHLCYFALRFLVLDGTPLEEWNEDETGLIGMSSGTEELDVDEDSAIPGSESAIIENEIQCPPSVKTRWPWPYIISLPLIQWPHQFRPLRHGSKELDSATSVYKKLASSHTSFHFPHLPRYDDSPNAPYSHPLNSLVKRRNSLACMKICNFHSERCL